MGLRLVLAGRQGGGRLEGREQPAHWLTRAQGWVEGAAAGSIEELRREIDGRGNPLLSVRLHPAAEDVCIVAAGQGKVVATANTFTVGPGYHRYVCELLHHLGDALGIGWLGRGAEEGVGDPTGYFETGDAAALEERMLAWLASVAEHALDMARTGADGVSVSLRFGHSFESRAPLLTPMGPRDRQWLEEVCGDPRRGIDVFPWWAPGTRGAAQLGRALTRLWTDVVWRPPLLEEERKVYRDVALRLEAAFRDDPKLPYPWHEWREVLGYLGVAGTMAEEVSRRAAGEQRADRIGYRRSPMRVELGDGWSIRIPGSLAECRTPEGSWIARDHRRLVRFTPIAGSAAPLPEGDPGLDRLEHRGERVRSRALLRVSDGGCHLVALCQAGRRRALCSIAFEDRDDEPWALETWRSVDSLPMA